MAYDCFVKTYAFISALMSVAVLASSVLVLISSITSARINDEINNSSSQDNNYTSFTSLQNSSTPDNGQMSEPPVIVPLMTTPPLQSTTTTYSSILNEKEKIRNMSTALSTSMSPASNTSTTAIHTVHNGDGKVESEDPTNATTSSIAPWNVFFEHQHDFWETKSDTYIILIQASSGTGIFAALLQLGFCWLLICGSAKDLKARATLWNLSNFIVLILVVVIILVPLSYNPVSNTFKGSATFWKEIYRKIKSVEFSSKTLETIWKSFSGFLVTDLTLYYYVLGVDAFILLASLIPPLFRCLCYPCKRCCCRGKRGRSDSDLMLFGTGGGGASGDSY